MRLFSHDAYHSLTRVFQPDESIVAVDVGANEGHTAKRILELFPRAAVYAFEPSPSVLDALNRTAATDQRIHVVPMAAGAEERTVDFHVTDEHWCSSVLAPSELGKRFYGSWLDVKQTVSVPMVRLDHWAKRTGLARVDLLKVDAQGYDLEVLRGAEAILQSGVRAINCEFQFAQEYRGCSTFSEIDTFLKSHGFALYQIHELSTRGNEEQTSYGDGLWLHVDTLAALRSRTDLPDLTPAARIRRAINNCTTHGPVAVYGAGRHTKQALPALGDAAPAVVAIIDDNPALRGTQLEGKPVINSRDALNTSLAAVILSSDTHEPALWRASQPLRAAGVTVIPLYGRYDN